MEQKENLKKIKIRMIIIGALVILTFTTISFGFFFGGFSQQGESGVSTLTCFDVTFSDGDSINLTNAVSVSDEVGLQGKPYEFTLTNNCDTGTNYYIILNIKEGSFGDEYINMSLNGNSPIRLTTNSINEQFEKPEGYSKSYILGKGTIKRGTPETNSLKLWINSEATYAAVQGKVWEAQVKVVSVVKELDVILNSTPAEETLASLNLKKAENNTVNFAEPATTDETANGLYSLEDDYGTSYYFRGAVENNYVKFGDYFWRIIRINGDGSLRMIYDGTQAYANGTSNAGRVAWQDQEFNSADEEAKYVGYMYGPAGTAESTSKEETQSNTESSAIKTKLEEWYVNNIKSKGLDQYVADSIFCNDRSTPGKEVTGWSSDTGLGYGKNVTAYGAYARLYHAETSGFEPTPQFACPNKNDAFTVSDEEKGNGALEEKVGLITADEIVAGGSGKYNTSNSSYYLYKGAHYWSLSPTYLTEDQYSHYLSNLACIFIESGNIDGNNIAIHIASDISVSVAPVINLSAEYVKTLRGEGTMSKPYQTESEIKYTDMLQ